MDDPAQALELLGLIGEPQHPNARVGDPALDCDAEDVAAHIRARRRQHQVEARGTDPAVTRGFTGQAVVRCVVVDIHDPAHDDASELIRVDDSVELRLVVTLGYDVLECATVEKSHELLVDGADKRSILARFCGVPAGENSISLTISVTEARVS